MAYNRCLWNVRRDRTYNCCCQKDENSWYNPQENCQQKVIHMEIVPVTENISVLFQLFILLPTLTLQQKLRIMKPRLKWAQNVCLRFVSPREQVALIDPRCRNLWFSPLDLWCCWHSNVPSCRWCCRHCRCHYTTCWHSSSSWCVISSALLPQLRNHQFLGYY